MRWIGTEGGDVKIVRKFLLTPKKDRSGCVRWLERAYVYYEYESANYDSMGGWRCRGIVDSDEDLQFYWNRSYYLGQSTQGGAFDKVVHGRVVNKSPFKLAVN